MKVTLKPFPPEYKYIVHVPESAPSVDQIRLIRSLNDWAKDPDNLFIGITDAVSVTQIQLPATFRLDTEDTDGG